MKCDKSAARKLFGLSTFVIVTAIPSSTGWAQTIPKQGTVDVTYHAVASDVREIEVSGSDAVYLFEATLLFTNNSKTPLMQNITAHCVEAGFSAGPGNGYCVFTDKDGDKFVEAITHPKGATAGKGTLGSGSGKYKGIEGQLDWQQVLSLPGEKGSFNFVGKKTGSYRIP